MRADAKEEAAASCGLSTVSSSTKSETFAVEMYLGPTVSAMKDNGTTQHPCSASHFMSPGNTLPGWAPKASAMPPHTSDCSGNNAGIARLGPAFACT